MDKDNSYNTKSIKLEILNKNKTLNKSFIKDLNQSSWDKKIINLELVRLNNPTMQTLLYIIQHNQCPKANPQK